MVARRYGAGAIISRYRRRITLEPEELQRLPAVMAVRPLLLDCWAVAHRDRSAAVVAAELAQRRGACERIAELARRGLA